MYAAPVRDIVGALRAAGLDALCRYPAFASCDEATARDLIETFGELAVDVVLPTDRIGDREGVSFDADASAVTTPPAIRHAYRRLVEGGWPAVSAPVEYGGGGFPALVGTALDEILTSTNLSLSLAPVLTHGAVELLTHWGTDAQRSQYLPKLVAGEWTGTMILTEPDAGSDVGAVTTRAEPAADGTYRVTGMKIFSTWGEHDLVGNIVHFVLARTPGSPPGTHGISLFLVPKWLEDGTRNRVFCRGIEHKLGLHASPTCVLEFDGATAQLVAPEHGGMQAMFTMMNSARLAIGVEGLATAERAYQQALAYAHERRQGHEPGSPPGMPSPIIEHPDVARMLADLRATTRAMRLLIYHTAARKDVATHAPDSVTRDAAQLAGDLLTPLAKAWPTDEGFRLASLAVQVHGGMGFIEETGVAQLLRDVRVASIYEGTNGIQAIDLVTRKIARDDGRTLRDMLDAIRPDASALTHAAGGSVDTTAILVEAEHTLRDVTDWVVRNIDTRPRDALAGATPYLHLCATVVAGMMLARHAADELDDELLADAAFFAVERVVPALAAAVAIRSGAGRIGSLTTWQEVR